MSMSAFTNCLYLRRFNNRLMLSYQRFPWGDGQKSLFHNPHVNALPDGYEDTDEH